MADLNVDVPTITSEEELIALLDAQGAEGTKDDGNPDGKEAGKGKKDKVVVNDDDDDDLSNVGKDKTPKGKDQSSGTKDNDSDEDEDEGKVDGEFGNVIAFLDAKHKLNLNLDNIPKDLTREDEAEMVSDLFAKVVEGTNNQIRKYQGIQKLLEDEEIVLLLKAKSEGKGLKDLYGNFVASVDGMTDEQLVFDDLKKKYPKLPEASINNMVATLKKENQFAEMATAAREQRKEDDVKSTQQRLQEEQDRKAREQVEREAEDQNFAGFVTKIGKINGVSFTDDMKAEVLDYALERDENGQSKLDKALQSDLGVLRAALGITLLEKLMGANVSVETNKKNKKLIDRLFESPSQANAGSGGARDNQEIPDELYNRF